MNIDWLVVGAFLVVGLSFAGMIDTLYKGPMYHAFMWVIITALVLLVVWSPKHTARMMRLWNRIITKP